MNGRVAAKALVDTGATAVTLCSDLAKSLGLKLGKPADVATMNGPVSGRGTWLTSIEIGEIVIRNVPAIVMDNQDCTEVILGMSALRQLHAIVLSGDALILFGARIRQKQ